ncbi:MAG TPA: hypothetical protein DCR04_10900 [Flavobacteriales bacterium]|nr:hypothetical protein [Flavobacteriales bacterium]
MKNESYAVVIPFYNGLDTIEELVTRIAKVFSELTYSYRVIIIDDSADETKHSKLQAWFKDSTNISLISLERNSGQHFATMRGLKNAEGSVVITMDEDLQHNPEDIPKLIETRLSENVDVVYGNRLSKNWRFWVGKVILTVFFPNGPKTTCSFRLLDETIVRKLVKADVTFYELEGLIYKLQPSYGYADIRLETTAKGSRKSSYSLIKLYSLISNLIAYYSWFPIILLAVAVVGIQLWLVSNLGFQGLFFLPLTGFSVVTLMAYISTRTRNPNS